MQIEKLRYLVGTITSIITKVYVCFEIIEKSGQRSMFQKHKDERLGLKITQTYEKAESSGNTFNIFSIPLTWFLKCNILLVNYNECGLVYSINTNVFDIK